MYEEKVLLLCYTVIEMRKGQFSRVNGFALIPAVVIALVLLVVAGGALLTRSSLLTSSGTWQGSCRQGFQSESCLNQFNQSLKTECNFEANIRKPTVTFCVGEKCQEGNFAANPESIQAINCANNYYRQFGQIACEQKPDSIDCQCSKTSEPLSCLAGNIADTTANQVGGQLSTLYLTILCPLKSAFQQTLGFGPFDKIDCSVNYPLKEELSQSDSNSIDKCQQLGRYDSECADYYEVNCQDDSGSIGCQGYCQDQATQGWLSDTCSQYFKLYCLTVDYFDEGCRVLVQQEYPNAADFCYRFPQARICQELGF